MKNNVWPILLLILLTIIPNIHAVGKVYNIGFTEEINQQILTIGLKDRVDFELVNGKHTILIDTIIPNKQVELDIFRYINLESEIRSKEYPVGYVTLHLGEEARINLNVDKYEDLIIQTREINEEETTLIFVKIHKCIFSNPELCEEVQEEPTKNNSSFLDFFKNINKIGLLIILVIIIIGILLFHKKILKKI